MATAKRAKAEQIAIEASSGNVFEDLGLPDAGERLAKAELARVIRTSSRSRTGRNAGRLTPWRLLHQMSPT
jgi:hypothetical protein